VIISSINQNTKAAKDKLLQEIDNLEKERSRIGSVQADALESSVLDRVLANSPLAEGNRSQLPSHMRGKADEVCVVYYYYYYYCFVCVIDN
jgi:hypothetical protein